MVAIESLTNRSAKTSLNRYTNSALPKITPSRYTHPALPKPHQVAFTPICFQFAFKSQSHQSQLRIPSNPPLDIEQKRPPTISTSVSSVSNGSHHPSIHPPLGPSSDPPNAWHYNIVDKAPHRPNSSQSTAASTARTAAGSA